MPVYDIREEGYSFASIEADNSKEALDIAVDKYAGAGDYDTSSGTICIDWYAARQCDCVLDEDGDRVYTDDEGDICFCRCFEDCESRTIMIDPDEPPCTSPEHDWQSPYSILGGLKDNPGVWGHGAGFIMKSVCMRCGCGRTIDTWAQNPTNGQQGITCTSYDPNEYAHEVAEK
jgi:hypothetical protein